MTATQSKFHQAIYFAYFCIFAFMSLGIVVGFWIAKIPPEVLLAALSGFCMGLASSTLMLLEAMK